MHRRTADGFRDKSEDVWPEKHLKQSTYIHVTKCLMECHYCSLLTFWLGRLALLKEAFQSMCVVKPMCLLVIQWQSIFVEHYETAIEAIINCWIGKNGEMKRATKRINRRKDKKGEHQRYPMKLWSIMQTYEQTDIKL